MSSELETLASAACDNRATDAQLARLAELLRDDSAACEEYLRYVDLHSALADEALPVIESNVVDYKFRTSSNDGNSERRRATGNSDRSLAYASRYPRTLAKLLAIVASVIVIAGVGFLASRQPREIAEDNAPSLVAEPPVATMLLSEDCHWSGHSLSEGDRLNIGRVDLEIGTAVLRFDGGAELVMVGPTSIELQSAGSVLVRNGDVVVRATDGAEGFVVTTPTSEVVDLGTEFAVKVNRSGTTEVHVLDGEVSYRGLNAAEELSKILRTGEGVEIDEQGRPTAVPMNSPRFQEFIRRINPRTRVDLLTAYEGFNYSPGVLPLRESTVGKGWAGPWRKRLAWERTLPSEDFSPDHFEIVHGEMKVAWPVPGGRLGTLKLPGGGVYYVRPMADELRLDRDDVTFFSLMVRETERRTGNDRPRERLRLTFRSSEDYDGQAISFGHGSGYRPTIRTGDGISYTSPLVLPPEQTTLWIGKIVSRKQGEDEIYFRVYGEADVLDYAEPATWHVVTRGAKLNTNLDLVLLSSEGETARLVDELRIGPTWRSVAPMTEKAE